MRRTAFVASVILGVLWPVAMRAAEQERAIPVPVILDTDIGDALDDASALALLLESPEVELCGVTTVSGDAYTRALIVCRLLYAVGWADVPVAAGRTALPKPDYRGQMQYGLRPCFRKRPEKDLAVEFLYRELRKRPGKITLLAAGPLTNIAALLTRHSDCKPWIARIVVMGGSLKVGYDGKPQRTAEWNIKSDVTAAQTVFSSGVPLVVVPLDATALLKLDAAQWKRLRESGTRLGNELQALKQLSGAHPAGLHDPLATALCFTERFARMEELALRVDSAGHTLPAEGKPNARVATAVQRDAFLRWFLDRLAPKAAARLPGLKLTNPAQLVPRGKLPERVHVIEDYETDIERRWWLCGLLETKNVPPGSRRACRGVWTNDFDDRHGDREAMYTAVIFNPVPGPPMGKQTRLGFRYFLKGTDRLRVQIYSLSKGYHRHLTLTGLPQGVWREATVDMTEARRPDGSGGPLAENERIDDLQFYTDPDAELLIDDVILYEAAAPGESRPFPARPIFTGWFDTGGQGKEWPGEFTIVPRKPPHTWKAARSVPKEGGRPSWLAVHLRGERPVGARAVLRFRYHLTGADAFNIRLARPGAEGALRRLRSASQGEWTEAEVVLPAPPRGMADAVHFLLRPGAELLVDDLLLFESGEKRE